MKAKLIAGFAALAVAAVTLAALAAVSALTLLKPAPEVRFKPLAGEAFSTSELRGKVVLVNFWATWCAPCREEMPALQALQHRLGKERLVVLAVNYGESPEKVQQFAQHTPVDFPLLLDRHMEAAKAWQVRVLPTSFVLGQDGDIRYSAVGMLDWGDAQIAQLLTTLSLRP
jgi:thiol-disulfide isomerase/thioredoxin